MAVVFLELGQEVHITGGSLVEAINEGVRRGYVNGHLRCSVVSDPLRRQNTGDNTPAVLHTELVPGDTLKITIAPKGFGSENMSAMKMFTPAATQEDIENWIVSCVDQAGSNPCPPVIVGVGIGGTIDQCAMEAKKALLAPMDRPNEDPYYGDMEQRTLEKINKLGIGPQGMGGRVTALAVHIRPYATHIAGLPCVVNMSCHVTRHASGEL
jgi:fumarate hydratase subunit alpha